MNLNSADYEVLLIILEYYFKKNKGQIKKRKIEKKLRELRIKLILKKNDRKEHERILKLFRSELKKTRIINK